MINKIKLILFLIPLLASSALGFSQEPLHEVDFSYEVDSIIVPIKVNGSKPLKAIFDTGMPNGVFIPSPELGKSLKLKYAATNVPVSGGGNETRTASVATGTNIELGDIKLSGQQAIVLNDLTDIARFGFDAVVGASFFGNYVVEIDVLSQKLRFFDPKTFKPGGVGEAHDLTITQTKPYILGKVKSDSVTSKPLKIVIDTGARISMMINENEKLGVQLPKNHIEGIFGAGVGGDITAKGARLDSLNFGSFEMKGVTAQFTAAPVPAGADVLIGMRVLKRFKMTFDYGKNKLYLKPNKLMSEPFDFDLLGLVTRPRENGRIEVIGVFENSAGEKAGVKKGDFITGVEDKAISFDRWSVVRDTITKPGQKLKLNLMRDGKKVQKTLVAFRMI